MIHIVIINFNGDSDTIECIDSLLKSNDDNFQLFVIDNSPSDESISRVVHWLDKVDQTQIEYNQSTNARKLYSVLAQREFDLLTEEIDSRIVIVNGVQNNGFAAANNICLKYLCKLQMVEWVWLLNNDTIVPQNTIKEIRKKFTSSKSNIGIFGTKIYYAHQKELLQGVAGKYNLWTGTSTHVGSLQPDYDYSYKRFNHEADYIIGASMIVNKSFITDVGLMNEEYFLYYEEIDWAFRGKLKRWEIDLIPNAFIYHKEGASISKRANNISLLADKCFVVNRIKITRKYAPAYLISVYASIILVIVNRALRGQFSHIWPIIRAIVLNNPRL